MNDIHPHQRWLVGLLSLLLIGCAITYQCFMQRQVFFDEVGLFNPVYMYLHYGKMTYPAHEQFDTMFVHPPTQYFLVALLMRTGLSVYHAAGLLSVLLLAVFTALVISSRWLFPIQSGFLLGGFLGAFVWNEALVLRPDLTLTLAWMIGLVALETARLNNWSKTRLTLGGFFLALATAVHYPGILAGAGVIIYAILMARQLGRKAARPIAWMIAGASTVAVPYLVLFLVPHLRDILAFSLSIQNSAPPGTAFQHHMEAYKYWDGVKPEFMSLRPFTTLITEPLFRWSIPAAFVGPPLLLLLPETRVLGLAALPHLLFILFGARHKQTNFTGYFAPEIVLYLMALFSLSWTTLFAFLRKLGRARITLLASLTITGIGAAAALTEKPAVVVKQVTLTPGIYDFEVGHAAGRDMLGPDAVVGTSSAGVWYTSGATQLYMIMPDVNYPPDIRCLDLRKYFGSFDALAVDPHRSWSTGNRQRENITSSYADGQLQLRGFFFADRRDYYQSFLSYMLYALKPAQPLVGYSAKGETISRFQQDAAGDQVYLSALCPTFYAERHGPLDNTDLKLDSYAAFFRPISSGEDPQLAKDHSLRSTIVTLIANQQRFEKEIRPALHACAIRDEVAGRLTTQDLRAFVRQSQKSDQTVHFHRTFPELEKAVAQTPRRKDLLISPGLPGSCGTATVSARPLPTDPALFEKRPAALTFSMPGALRLDSLKLAYDKAAIRRTSPIQITTSAEQWSYAASIPIVLDRVRGSNRVIHIRGRVTNGQIGIGILNHQTNSFQREEYFEPSQNARDIYIPIPAPEQADDLIIRNTSETGVPSGFALEASEILAAAHQIDSCAWLQEITSAYSRASVKRGNPVEVTTAPEQGAYAAAMPIRCRARSSGVVIRIRARVASGEIGFGLLSADRQSFPVEQFQGPSDQPLEILLPLPATPLSSLIVRNVAPTGTASTVFIESIETWKLE